MQGQVYKAGPQPGRGHAVLLPGRPGPGPAGAVRLVLAAVVEAGAGRRRRGAIGGLLILDALFSPAFADPGYGFDQGYQEGFQDGADQGDMGDQGWATPAATPGPATTAAAVTSVAATSAVATSSSSVGLAG